MEEIKTFWPSLYAQIKGVHPSRITHLKDKLKTVKLGKKWLVIDCKENDELFSNPSHLRTPKENKSFKKKLRNK